MSIESGTFRFSSGDSDIQVTLVEEDTSSYASGDVNLSVDVASAGYSGGIVTWIVSSDFTKFCNQLKLLDSSLKGEASLESVSPDELNLRVYAVNARGGIAVDVSIGQWVQRRDEMFSHSVKVGFAFEPQQLAEALALPWIARRL